MNEQAIYEIKLKDSFSAPLRGLESKMNGFESSLGKLTKLAGGIGIAFGAAEGISAIATLGKKIIGLGADMEQTRVSFTTMLGSADRANATIAKLREFAEATPFRQEEVVTGAKQLLAFGFQADELTENLTRLGDVSAGLSVPIGDMIYLFGTLKTQGRAYTKDIMQFAQRGIPIFESLAEVLKVNKDQVLGLVEDGKVGFAEVDKAFKLMTKSGSMFGGLMDKQAKTLSGRWSTFLDKLESMGTNLGEKLIPTLGKVLDWMTKIVETIPKLDFTPLFYTFEQLWSQVVDVVKIWDELTGSVSESITVFDVLTGALRYVAYGFRVAYTPIRYALEAYKQLMNVVKESYGVFEGLGYIMQGQMSGNFKLMAQGVDKIKGALSTMSHNAGTSASSFWDKEKEGWAKIFGSAEEEKAQASSKWNPFGNTYNKMGLGGGPVSGSSTTTSGSGSGKSSTAGIEKVQSGTRNVTLNIQTVKLADNLVSNKADLSDVKIQEMLTRGILTALNDVNIVAQ
jgi:hypothetical protein